MVDEALGLKEFRFTPCAVTGLSCDLWQVIKLPSPQFPPLKQGQMQLHLYRGMCSHVATATPLNTAT